MSNWASEYANKIETRSDARKYRLQSRAQERALKKALAERDHLFREWQKWHKERKQQLLGGEHKEAAQELADFLEQMTNEDAPALLTLVENGPWRDSDRDVKFLVMELINHSIIYLREKAGLAPFDDPLPFGNEETNVFLSIRELLR
jgi:hypothetical protein